MYTVWQSEKGRLWLPLSMQPKLAHYLSARTVCQPQNTLPTRAHLTVLVFTLNTTLSFWDHLLSWFILCVSIVWWRGCHWSILGFHINFNYKASSSWRVVRCKPTGQKLWKAATSSLLFFNKWTLVTKSRLKLSTLNLSFLLEYPASGACQTPSVGPQRLSIVHWWPHGARTFFPDLVDPENRKNRMKKRIFFRFLQIVYLIYGNCTSKHLYNIGKR